jgi:Domain of unknown function (DUF4384)
MGMRNCLWLAAVMALSSVASWGQSARDTFWSASDLISVTPNPAAHNRSRPHSSSSAEKTSAPTVTPSTGSVYTPHDPRDEQVAQLVSSNGYGAAPHLVRSAESRLGLRCSLLLRGPDKEYNEVTPGTVFHSGDHIRLSLLANQSGYLYVVQKGSTGAWSPIYPPPSAASDAAKINPGQLEVVPGGTKAFQFDEHPGAERLYVILSRTPIEDIDRVIRNLSHGTSTPTSTADASLELEAKNVIPDELVQKLAGRDLKLVDEETVDASPTSAPDSERAVYVVAKKSDTPSSEQVILSLELRHE